MLNNETEFPEFLPQDMGACVENFMLQAVAEGLGTVWMGMYPRVDSIKKLSEGKKWNFEIPNDDSYPLMRMHNVSLDDELIGYIYVFNKDDSMVKDEKSYQYKCFKELKPIDVVTVRYGDFSSYYEVLDSEKVLK